MQISVIVPVYNGESFVEETLRSIQRQSFRDFEVLVMDDGSTDHTKDIVEKMHLEDERFRFVELEHQGAPGHARNEGLRLAKGEFVVYFDSDDIMMECMLEQMIVAMDDETDLVIGNARYYDIVRKCECDNEMGQFFGKKNYTYNDLFTINPFPCNKMYRRFFLLETGVLYLERIFNQDLGYFLCNVMHRPRFKVVDTIVMEYRIRPNSITTSKKTVKRHMDILKVFDQVFEEYEKCKAYDMEYGLYEMFIKTMIFKISFFDLRKDQEEIKTIRKYLYTHCPDWYRRKEYTSYYSLKKRIYNTILIRWQWYDAIGRYKSFKKGAH